MPVWEPTYQQELPAPVLVDRTVDCKLKGITGTKYMEGLQRAENPTQEYPKVSSERR